MTMILKKTALNDNNQVHSSRNQLERAINRIKCYRLKRFAAVHVSSFFVNSFDNGNALKPSQIADENKLILSRDDSKLFIAAMLNPPKPSEGLYSLFD